MTPTDPGDPTDPGTRTGTRPAPGRLLLRGGVVHTGVEDLQHTCVVVEDGVVVATGDDTVARAHEGADEVVDLDGAWVAPAFVDAHVHAVATGFLQTQLDLTGVASLAACLDRVAAHAAGQPPGSVLLGSGWDETTWPEHRAPTGAELERAAPGRRVCLGRIEGHSAVVSPALADTVPGLAHLDGWTPDGRVERDAHHAVAVVLGSLVGPDQRLEAARAAVRSMAAVGIAGFHENAAPHMGPEYEVDLVRRAAAESGLHAVVYWGELGAVDALERLGVAGLAGDLNADGAIGSRTAALLAPYADAGDAHAACGHAVLDAATVAEHVELCTRLGVQAGFHAIGDAALENVADGFERAAARVGAAVLTAARHRVEHVEMPSRHAVEVLGRLGVVASVQPVFDALWGGPDGMYAERLGERWRGMIPLRDLEQQGVRLAFGSDAPVTPLGPWEAVRAAVTHRSHEQRISPASAFRAHTRGGWEAGRDDTSGTLQPGFRADLAVWHLPGGPIGSHELPDLGPDAALPVLRRTVAAGRTVHRADVDDTTHLPDPVDLLEPR